MPGCPDLLMKTQCVSRFVAFCLLLVLGLPAEGAGPLTGEQVSLRAAYQAARHEVRAEAAGGLAAHNPGQRWHTRFDGHGFTVTPAAGGWTWGLELRRYGFAGAEQAVGGKARVSHEQGRVAYDWDATLREWFVNDTRGLEQGWTFHERPAGAAAGRPLRVELAIRGGLQAEVTPDGASVSYRQGAGAPALTYSGLKAWDADGRMLPVRFEPAAAGEGLIRVTVEEAGARYPVTVDPIAQGPVLIPGGAKFSENFGDAVAISGDTVVIGAPDEDSNTSGINGIKTNTGANGSGAAYVFVRNGNAWTQQAFLKASNTGQDDDFGYAVAISGDTLIVGAYKEDSAAAGIGGNQDDNSLGDAGAAYIFVRSGTTWTQQAYLKPASPTSNGRFGFAVGISGNRVVVTAEREKAAYVFVRDGTNWTEEARFQRRDTGSESNFGYCAAISRDTVFVGVPGVNGPGAAYVFMREEGMWAEKQRLVSDNGAASVKSGFGFSVALDGDTAIIGAVEEDKGGPSNRGEGAAYVFVRAGTNWSKQARLKASNPDFHDSFGWAVGLSGNIAVVSALGEDSSARGINGNELDNSDSSGAAYVYLRSGTNWTKDAYLKARGDERGVFGWAAAVSGLTIVVGENSGFIPGTFDAPGIAEVFELPEMDSDGDGLLDRWESENGGIDVNGDGIIDLDLYALGARPDHKDLFVEIDAAPLPISDQALTRVALAFAQAPVQNPDKVPGIRLHLELDETGIIVPPGVTDPTGFPFKFRETKTNHFGTLAQRNPDANANPNRTNILAAKARVYRYCLVQDFINFGELTDRAYNGIGEIGGNDFVINLSAQVHRDGFRDIDDQAATFMHELGHSLGLRHGGGVDEVIAFVPKSWQGKPNYPSLMNYVLTHPLKEKQNKLFWRLDYSREQLPDLNETSLNENAGIPSTLYRKFVMPYGVGPDFNRTLRLVRLNGSAADFNRDGTTDQGVSADLNYFGTNTVFAGVDRPSPEEIMKGHNDWANLQYAVIDDEREADRDISIAEGCPTMEMLNFLEANVPPDPDSFEGWVAGFPALGNQNGFSDDPDGDSVGNGFERFFGTHPIESSAGLTLTAGSTIAGFQHSRSKSPGADAVASYEWSTNLTEWHPSGETVAGISVTLTAVVIATTATTETVAITPVSTGAPSVLFYRLRLQLLE